MKFIALSFSSAVAACVLSACAVPTTPAAPTTQAVADLTAEVQPQGNDHFLISLPGDAARKAAQLKADALQRADAYCASLSKGLQVDEATATSTRPPGYAVRFTCVAKPAPE
jgi:hypothetical protein